jgi:glycine dehydrogenase
MTSFSALEHHDAFIERHVGPSPVEQQHMLSQLGFATLNALMDAIVPARIRSGEALNLPGPRNEPEVLAELKRIATRNQVWKSYLGMGYYGTHTPGVILRNILENPAWYTAYTPYQPEISQGRLEALINFQQMVTDLTGMDVANASMLDEATAAAEAAALAKRMAKSKSSVLIMAGDMHPQTLAVVKTRMEPLGIEVKVGFAPGLLEAGDAFAVMAQYPSTVGMVHDMHAFAQAAHAKGALVIVAADLLSLTLLKPPGEWGADIVVGSAQRFGVPMGYGGPHAGFFAVKQPLVRQMPGRLVGVSVDAYGQRAYRLALATREQHIRREKATSNICTAQVLLSVMASMYGVYHGPEGLTRIAQRVHRIAATFAEGARRLGYQTPVPHYFDTVMVDVGPAMASIVARAAMGHVNLRKLDDQRVVVAFDETTTAADIETLWSVFAASSTLTFADVEVGLQAAIPDSLKRESRFLTHPVFNTHHSETEMLRYIRSLSDKDLALDRTMIPLGSCTMKLNATTEMIPVTWPEFGQIHPFAPAEQAAGYRELIQTLEAMLVEVTGYDAVSLQPNSGAQGEFAGLLAIRAYHRARGDLARNIVLIPSSAHGTNPASASMVGMDVVVVKCDEQGNVDVADLKAKAEQHSHQLAALMVTYPSTHGVFEEAITEICDIIHTHGGQVYMDGANLNALVGIAAPGKFGADVSHLNLHKTFCIPHGGGGPGVGPVAVRAHLAPFLPSAVNFGQGESWDEGKVGPVSAAPFGSASILPISYTYMALMGGTGLTHATEVAILNANYIAKRLAGHYPVLYTGAQGLVAHECILDIRPIKDACGISNEDVAKRLIDYGFHAPTMSFPVPGTLMIEPTESESLVELNRFIDAMIAIRGEIRAVEEGRVDKDDNVLRNAPHTAQMLLSDDWVHDYPRSQAAYPLQSLKLNKYWPPVGRVDNVYGDRNLACSCPPVSDYAEAVN